MTAMTIESFHAQISSSEESPLLAALRSLMTVEKEKLLALFETATAWTGWPTF
jgi:hypothetical protein